MKQYAVNRAYVVRCIFLLFSEVQSAELLELLQAPHRKKLENIRERKKARFNILCSLVFRRERLVASLVGTALWGKKGMCVSFWPKNSGIGIYFCWKISVIALYFHLEFFWDWGLLLYSKFC